MIFAKMRTKNQFLFWLTVLVMLTLVFSTSLGSILFSFYFVTFLFPVILGASIVFNRVLVTRFLLNERYLRFALYFFYLIVISVYLELLVIILSFVILANYHIENLGAMASDIYLLSTILFLIVFISGFVEIVIGFKNKSASLDELEKRRKEEQRDHVMITVDRKSVRLAVEEIYFVESLSNHVKIHTLKKHYSTRQKISSFEESLPSNFIRIHRSFIVNGSLVQNFSKELVTIGDTKLPIGRKYKKEAYHKLGLKAIKPLVSNLK